jgi:hypothetical protein
MYLQFISYSFKLRLSAIISASFIWWLLTFFLKLVQCFMFSGPRTLRPSLLHPEVSRLWWIKHSSECNRNWISWPRMTYYTILIMCASCWFLISRLIYVIYLKLQRMYSYGWLLWQLMKQCSNAILLLQLWWEHL